MTINLINTLYTMDCTLVRASAYAQTRDIGLTVQSAPVASGARSVALACKYISSSQSIDNVLKYVAGCMARAL
jgi:hypothetical protein